MPKTTKTSTNDVCIPYGKSIIETMKDKGLVIGADDMENYIKFTDYMELQKERDNRKALSEEREENCWALAKVIDEQEKKIKKLRDEIEELKEKLEDSDRGEDYRYERWKETSKQLLKIKCVLNDEDYPYEN